LITTVAWASTPDLVCAAHAHGARAVMAAPAVDLAALAAQPNRTAWIASALAKVQVRAHQCSIWLFYVLFGGVLF
jgi:hypothetical protein